MKVYELTYIISSQSSTEEAEIVKNDIESFIQTKEGVILRSEKMGGLPLSYPIKKQASGYFNVTNFQVLEEKVKEIKKNIDKNNKVLRSIIIVKKPVKERRERKSRRSIFMKEFEVKRKPFIMEETPYKEPRKEEKVNEVDLDKKLDEILSE